MSVLMIWKVLSDCESQFFLAAAPATENTPRPQGDFTNALRTHPEGK